jgi:hypothetical protein
MCIHPSQKSYGPSNVWSWPKGPPLHELNALGHFGPMAWGLRCQDWDKFPSMITQGSGVAEGCWSRVQRLAGSV